VLTGLLGGSVALAAEEDSNDPILSPPTQEEPQPEEPPIKFTCKFPAVKGVAGDTFEFQIVIKPSNYEYAMKYDFNVIAPSGWKAGVWGDYPEKRISSINFAGETLSEETVKVKAGSLSGERPEPGEYVITLEMESETGDLKASIDLTAVVTASYEFDMYTETGRLNAQAKAAEDNHISILLINTGTAAIENITFSSDEPEGWSTIYNPEKIDSLEPGLKREVDVVIKPPKKAIAGDYPTTLKAESEHGSDSLELRVTVVAPRVGGGAGIGIAVGVIVGLVVLFRRPRMR
jgi:uncharacterized membrane protein